jgi:hypothetical protein
MPTYKLLHSLLNVSVQIANKMGLQNKKINVLKILATRSSPQKLKGGSKHCLDL